MNKYVLVFLFLAVSATLDFSSGTGIIATYEEEVAFVDNYLLEEGVSYPHNTEDGSSEYDIIERLFTLPTHTYIYWLIAEDTQNNPTIHDIYLSSQGDFVIRILSPGPEGTSSQARYNFTVQTPLPATCNWSFHVPNQEPLFHDFTGNNINHTVKDFSARNRFIVNEVVPVQVKCVGEDGSQAQRIIPLGFSDSYAQLSTNIFPKPVFDSGDPVEITVHSEQITSCSVSSKGQDDITSFSKYTHVFAGLPSGGDYTIYYVDCTDAYGNNLPREEVGVNHNYAALSTDIELTYPNTPSNTPLLSVRTNRFAKCEVTSPEAVALGTLAQGRNHQRILDIEGETPIAVRCVADDIPSVAEFTLIEDSSAPKVKMPTRPVICKDKTIVTLNSKDNPSYVLLQTETGSVLREWIGEETIVLHQGDIGQLVDGWLRVRGVDAAGNIGDFHELIFENSMQEECYNAGIAQQISLLSPANGFSTEQDFSLEVETEFPSTCSWRIGGGSLTEFESTGSLSHTVSSFPSAASLEAGEQGLEVSCTHGVDERTNKGFVLQWKLDAPTFTAEANPNPVIDLDDQTTQITVTSDQTVRCAYDDSPFTPEAKKIHSIGPLTIPYGISERTVTITCENLGGIRSTQTVAITTEYNTLLTMKITTPDITRTASLPLEVLTSGRADCVVVYEEDDNTLTSNGGVRHTRSLQLSGEGKHQLLYRCVEQVENPGTIELAQEVLFDQTPPAVNLTGPAYTCGGTSYTVEATATDLTGVKEFVIEFASKTYRTAKMPYTIKKLNLTEGEKYSLEVTATDLVNNTAKKSTLQVQAQSKESGTCDTEKPFARIITKQTNEGLSFYLLCKDDESRCADSYMLGYVPSGGECKQSKYLFSENKTFNVTQKTDVCFHVEDVAGNVVEGKKTLSPIEIPSHCSSKKKDGDETGVDCGGSCQTCETGACEKGSDCSSGVCSKQNTCEQTSCSNGIKDGFETGVDCGGTDLSCDRCSAGNTCENRFDCASGICDLLANTCTAPTCDDGRKNQDEIDVDCGGVCGQCSVGDRCVSDSDCDTEICSATTCTTERNDPYNPSPDLENPLPTSQGSNMWGWILIFLGMLLAMGGGGYIYYEQQGGHLGKSTPTSKASVGTDMFSSQRLDPLEKPTPAQPDYSQSKLREEAKRKRREEREAHRDDLLRGFEGQKEQAAPEKKVRESKPISKESEDAIEDLRKMTEK